MKQTLGALSLLALVACGPMSVETRADIDDINCASMTMTPATVGYGPGLSFGEALLRCRQVRLGQPVPPTPPTYVCTGRDPTVCRPH